MPRELQELIQDQLNSFEILDSDPNIRDALWRLFVAYLFSGVHHLGVGSV